MALQDQLKKINIDNLDTKGLYFKDTHNFFNKKEINKKDLKNCDHKNIDIVLKFYFRNKQIKKTLNFSKTTDFDAVKNAADKKSICSDGTYETNTTFFNKWIKKELCHINFEKIKTLDLQNIVNTIKSINPKTNELFKPRTAKSVKDQMRALYNYYIKQELIERNPGINIQFKNL